MIFEILPFFFIVAFQVYVTQYIIRKQQDESYLPYKRVLSQYNKILLMFPISYFASWILVILLRILILAGIQANLYLVLAAISLLHLNGFFNLLIYQYIQSSTVYASENSDEFLGPNQNQDNLNDESTISEVQNESVIKLITNRS